MLIVKFIMLGRWEAYCSLHKKLPNRKGAIVMRQGEVRYNTGNNEMESTREALIEEFWKGYDVLIAVEVGWEMISEFEAENEDRAIEDRRYEFRREWDSYMAESDDDLCYI